MTQHPWKAGALLESFIAFSIAAAMMFVAWVHNAQGEIHDESGADRAYWFLIGLSWFVVTALPLSLVSDVLLKHLK